ncbi:MAG: hypothetical protein M4579_002143 [Chaenotheca gracillima]|nr:MAG: hypothetical protein M4579_002143 [Chaenotheca gracillima]
MDAPDEPDIRLQRLSSDLLLDFNKLLPVVLLKGSEGAKSRPRERVSEKATNKLVTLIEPFQEWPQLLDPHLADILPVITTALADFVVSKKVAKARVRLPSRTLPFQDAVGKLLYTFCKIRGHKVVSRFFLNHPRYLEPLMLSFQKWTHPENIASADIEDQDGPLSWEGRYVVLLWLSHLMLAPFDLSLMSSLESSAGAEASEAGLQLPQGLPKIAIRLLNFGFEHIASPSKEREPAIALLVRLAVRQDMFRQNLTHSLIQYAFSALEAEDSDPVSKSIYWPVGLLSFVGGVLVSADFSVIEPYVVPAFRLAQLLLNEDKPSISAIRSSALARKWLIKICRAATLQSLPTKHSFSPTSSELLEDCIDVLLAALADQDTPVRLAASKALAIISARLDPGLASDVVDAVVGALSEDVLWFDRSTGREISSVQDCTRDQKYLVRDLSAVNPLRWHGLTLTLSHMLFRRSSTPQQLPDVINALVLALEFEQRSSTQKSTGTNIRDAACFGVWSLSRKYTTTELAGVDTSQILAAGRYSRSLSALQLLANELVIAACLDPAGNIRRGSSAALQEMIGRHPDAVQCGIALVQAVDYHSVALRSRAMLEVGLEAARLDSIYRTAICENLLSWRCLRSSDASSRRLSASTIGTLSVLDDDGTSSTLGSIQTLEDIERSLQQLQRREVKERHGLLLALAAVLSAPLKNGLTSASTLEEASDERSNLDFMFIFRALNISLSTLESLTETDFTSSVLWPSITAEATSQLISSTMQLLRISKSAIRGQKTSFDKQVSTKLTVKCLDLLSLALLRTDSFALEASSSAARETFLTLDLASRHETASSWVDLLSGDGSRNTSLVGGGIGHINSLGSVFTTLGDSVVLEDNGVRLSEVQQAVASTLMAMSKADHEVEIRVAAVQNLTKGIISKEAILPEIVDVLALCLDDYTIDSRGDVGSWLRLAAIDAVGTMYRKDLLPSDGRRIRITEVLLSRVLRLSVEQLDKVRFAAWSVLREAMVCEFSISFESQFDHLSQISTTPYFYQLISLIRTQFSWAHVQLMEGYIASAGGGSESVLRASRQAMVTFAEGLQIDESQGDSMTLLSFCNVLLEVLRRNLSDDRKLVSCMEVIAFLLDARILQKLEGVVDFKWRTLLAFVQRSHYKSGNMPKLEAAIKIYGGLNDISAIRYEVLKKLGSMLLHPLPMVRNHAAECLYIITVDPSISETLQGEDWSMSPKDIKSNSGDLQSSLLAKTRML